MFYTESQLFFGIAGVFTRLADNVLGPCWRIHERSSCSTFRPECQLAQRASYKSNNFCNAIKCVDQFTFDLKEPAVDSATLWETLTFSPPIIGYNKTVDSMDPLNRFEDFFFLKPW